MNFVSLHFWALFAIGLALLSVIRLAVPRAHRSRYDGWAFIGLSLTLLGSESLVTLAAFLWVSAIGFAAMRSSGRAATTALVLLMLSPLGYFKYANFLSDIIIGRPAFGSGSLLIPMGISFYTFQLVALVVDTRRDALPRPSLRHYLNFASFFPQIVAGPIERRADLLPQVAKLQLRTTATNIELGLRWIVLGFFFKLALAENFALLDQSMAHGASALAVWCEAFFFGFRIYFDFAGYSFIALGLAQCFGVQLTLNFRSPYLASDLSTFWRHWHITLSNWLRDYVYIPLGGSRGGRVARNILIVFIVSGIWHGAGWGFIIWGALHGIGVIVAHSAKGLPFPRFAKWPLTLAFVMLTWIFFKDPDVSSAAQKMRSLVDLGGYRPSLAHVQSFLPGRALPLALLMGVLTALVLTGEWISQRRNEPYTLLKTRLSQIVLIALTFFLMPAEESRFIYFNF